MKTVISFLIALIVGTGVFAYISRDRVIGDSEARIGLLLCLSGECAEPGTNAQHGAELAAEQINSNGGVLGRKVRLVTQDSNEMVGGAQVISAYRALRRDSLVKYIIGPTWTVGGLPLVPVIAKDREILITSPSLGVADFNEGSRNAFNLWPHDSVGTKGLAQLAMDRGWKRAAVLSNQGPWESAQAKVFAEEFKRLGGEIVAFIEPAVDIKDLRTEALQIKSANPDVVFMSNYTQMDVAAKDLRRLQYSGRKMAILMDETRLKNSEGALDGTIYAIYPEAKNDFAARFKAKFGVEPGISAAQGYDAVQLYARAVTAAHSFDIETVRETMSKIKFEGASGEIEFDGKRGVTKRPVFWSVRDSKQVPLE